MHISRRGFTGGALSVALGSQLERSRLRPVALRPCAGARRNPRLWRSAPQPLRPSGPDARRDNSRRIFDGPRLRLCQRRRANTDHRGHALSDRLDQQIDDLHSAAPVRGRRAASASPTASARSCPNSRCRAAMRSLFSTCSTIPPDCPAIPRCSPMAACGPPMRPARTGIIRTRLMRCWASSPSTSAASRSAICSRSASSRHWACAAATARSSAPTARCTRRAMRPPTRQRSFAWGLPLAPAAWVDVTFGAGSVASTAEDMTRFLRFLANAAQGRGGLGLPPEQARAFMMHAVPSDTPGMSYGNGLMHVGNGRRSYLHHTGGMVSFSSSFHVDVASGVGAFASSPLSAFAEYRPRLLTRFAVDALTNAAAGKPLPVAAAALDPPLPNAPLTSASIRARAARSRCAPGRPLTHRRQRAIGAATALGRRSLPHDASGVPPVFAAVPAQQGRDHRRELGTAELRAAGRRRRDLRPPIRHWRGSPAATSTTARGSARPSSWSAAASCGSAPRHRWLGSATISGASAKRAGRPSAHPSRISSTDARRPSFSRARSSSVTTSRLAPVGAARSAAMDVLEASRITPEMVAEHGLSDEEYAASSKRSAASRTSSSSASSRSCGRSIAATKARASI